MHITLSHISKSYGKTQALSDFSHCFPSGGRCCILGSSGCGKTTLLRIIAGLETPDSGSISGLSHQKISAVFQEDRLIENLSAEKNILLTARRGFTRPDARALLAELGMEEGAGKPVSALSGGMKRRVAIARALAAAYDLLLLDEPLGGLDADTRLRVLNVISAHAQGHTLICVTHDPAAAAILHADALHLA